MHSSLNKLKVSIEIVNFFRSSYDSSQRMKNALLRLEFELQMNMYMQLVVIRRAREPELGVVWSQEFLLKPKLKLESLTAFIVDPEPVLEPQKIFIAQIGFSLKLFTDILNFMRIWQRCYKFHIFRILNI